MSPACHDRSNAKGPKGGHFLGRWEKVSALDIAGHDVAIGVPKLPYAIMSPGVHGARHGEGDGVVAAGTHTYLPYDLALEAVVKKSR